MFTQEYRGIDDTGGKACAIAEVFAGQRAMTGGTERKDRHIATTFEDFRVVLLGLLEGIAKA